MGLDMNARVRGFYNWRPLHLAAAAGQYAAVQHLIEQGADIFNTADGGLTALHVAAFMGHTTIVTTLLSHIPDAGTEKRFLMAQTGGSMETALHLAAASHYCSDALLNALCTRGERVYWTGLANLQGERPIHRAAASQHPEALKWFLSVVKQWNLDEEDRFGRTPLWHAAAVGSVDGVRRLARAGASVNHADMYGRTPLHIAVCEGHEDVVTCLL
ncbi:ankyrin repeat-containing domain protein, partial [Lasiosphaeria miniovina]